MKIFKRVVRIIISNYFFILFKTLRKTENLIIFDIDNTLTINKLNAPVNQSNPIINENMVQIFFNAKKQENTKVILLTARDYQLYLKTFFWVKRNLNLSQINQLFFVEKAERKIAYLKYAYSKYKNVIYYDDLSFNHENGEVKFYNKLIEEFKGFPICYIGYDEIQRITYKNKEIEN